MKLSCTDGPSGLKKHSAEEENSLLVGFAASLPAIVWAELDAGHKT
jgi:hypothetical protein